MKSKLYKYVIIKILPLNALKWSSNENILSLKASILSWNNDFDKYEFCIMPDEK
jgi:hypothetical protein